MYSHADTCCAGANLSLLEYTGQVFEISPFLDSTDAVQNIPIACCCTVWTPPETGKEYLIIAYLIIAGEMLSFGLTLENSLLNPNQLRAFGLSVNDNPFDTLSEFEITVSGDVLIPFETTGTIVHFESRVPSS